MIGLIENLIEMLDKLSEDNYEYCLDVEHYFISLRVSRIGEEVDDLVFHDCLKRSISTPNDLYLFQKKVQDFIVDNCMEEK